MAFSFWRIEVAEPAAAATGQANANSGVTTGTTATAPQSAQGQSVTQGQTTVSGSGQGSSEESLFDWKTIEHSPELVKLAKQLQGNYTKKSQELAAHKGKVDQYDTFMRSPLQNMQQLAEQFGYQLVQREPGNKPNETGWTPTSWQDVEQMIEKKANEIANRKTSGLQGQVVELKQQGMEARLDHDYPDWRVHEDKMMENLQAHPTLVSDPDLLYRMSVPQKLIEERSMAAALAKLKAGTDNAQVSGGSATVRQTGKPAGKMTFNEAAEHAKAELRRRGINPPAG